jgi:hypothetical protein
MDWIDQGFSWSLHRLKELMPAGFLTDLLVDGILAGINIHSIDPDSREIHQRNY